MKFEDTALLRHPTVEKAYNVMRTFFDGGDDWAREAVKPGEFISAKAESPDPDAIAASVLLNGMVVALEPSQFAASVSPAAAAYIQKFQDIDLDDPQPANAGERQLLLAQSVIGIAGAQERIDSGELQHIIEFRNVQRALDVNERLLRALGDKEEHAMAVEAQVRLTAAMNGMADIVSARLKEIAFENAGLPDHPTVRGVYAAMKDWALDNDPLGGYALANAGIARVVAETSAAPDPEVIAAALLNQYSVIREGHKAPAEFSPRIGSLYAQSSPWANFGKARGAEEAVTPEGQTIRNAALVFFTEERLDAYAKPGVELNATALEDLEDIRDRLSRAAPAEAEAALKARMEKAVSRADAFMAAPAQTKVRATGAPRIERD